MTRLLRSAEFHVCGSESFALTARKTYTSRYVEFFIHFGYWELYLSIENEGAHTEPPTK